MEVFKEKKNKAGSKPSCIRRRQILDVYEKGLECKKKIALESVFSWKWDKEIKHDHEIFMFTKVRC